MSDINKREYCPDNKGSKKDPKEYVNKCGRAVWKAEEQMLENFKCYDHAHAKAQRITESNRKSLEKYLQDYITNYNKPLCKSREDAILDCMNTENNIYSCYKAMQEFAQCLDSTIYEMSINFCEKQNQND